MNWCRAVAVIAMLLCGALAADYLSAQPTYCGFQAGCDDVIYSSYGSFVGVPLPLVGAVAFGSWLGFSLIAPGQTHALLKGGALCAGLLGGLLATIQLAVLGRVCAYCLLVDVCAIALAIFALAHSKWWDKGLPCSWTRAVAWLVVALLAFAAPMGAAWLRPSPEAPEQVRAQWLPNAITIVAVTDFDCKHCRVVHQALDQLLENQAKSVRLVRLVVALPRHANSRSAARAYLAACAQGKGTAMAAELFASANRTAAGCRAMAAALQLDLDDYDRALADPAGDAELDGTLAWAQAAGPGLPLVWIQERLFHGETPAPVLRRALRRAERNLTFTGNTAPLHHFIKGRD